MKAANETLEYRALGDTNELLAWAVKTIAVARQNCRTWKMRAMTRQALRELSPEMLHDIGVDFADAVREADKPFWRA